MATIARFFKTIAKSIYSPEFYWRLHKKQFASSMKYFWALIGLVSLVITVILAPALIISEKTFINKTFPSFVEKFPGDLTVKIENGEATTNQTSTITFAIPEDNPQSKKLKENGIENILVINTLEDFGITKFEGAKTLIMLSKNAISFGSKDDLRIKSLTNTNLNITIDRNELASYGEKAKNKENKIDVATVIVLWIAILVYLSLKLITFFFLAWIIGLLLRGKKHHLTYKKLYQITIHAATLGILLEVLHFFFLPSIPFLFSVITIMVALINFAPEKLENQEEKV